MSIQKPVNAKESLPVKTGEPRVVAVKQELIIEPGVAPKTPATTSARVPAEPAKPGEFFGDKHHKTHSHSGGHKGQLATVATERELLDSAARYREQLVGTIDELHTRLSPKYQIDQLKSTWTRAGTDALSILKNEGSPVDETRKKNAETVLKAGGAISGLFAFHGLRKLIKRARLNRTMRHAVAKGMPQEHVEVVGVVEALDNLGLGGSSGFELPETEEIVERLAERGLDFDDFGPKGNPLGDLDLEQIADDVAAAVNSELDGNPNRAARKALKKLRGQ